MPDRDMSQRQEQSRREAHTQRDGETKRQANTQRQGQDRFQAKDQAASREQARDVSPGSTQERSASRDQKRASDRERDDQELARRWPEMSEAADRALKEGFREVRDRAEAAHAALDAAGKRLGHGPGATAIEQGHQAIEDELQDARRDVVETREASRRRDETTAAEVRERLAQRKDEPERIAQRAVEEARRKEQEPSATIDRIRQDPEHRLQAVERYNQARMEQEEAARNLMDHEPISARRQRVGELAAAETPRPSALEAELSKIEALDRKTRELVKDQRSTAPAEIRRAQEERDALLGELEQRDLDREARAYVDWTKQSIEAKASLMNTGADLQEARSAKEKADAAVVRAQDALAEVSRTVNDLLRSGPEYQKLSRSPGPDEVMELQEWEQQRDQWRERGREIALQVDHLVAVAEIARSREMNRFLEVYERSSPKNRLEMEKELVAAFDTRENLVRMVDEVNRRKGDQGWGSLSASQVSPFYEDGHLRKMRDREDRMRGVLAKGIAEIAERYEKLRKG